MTALRSLVLSSRPLSWVNTAFPFGVAYYVATGSVDVVFVVGTVFFLIPYNVLMYGINDVFDYESDVLNPRKGGAEGALLAPELHRPMLWTSTLLALPFVVWLVFQGGVASWAMLALSLVSVVAYSTPPLRCKEIPGLDSVTSSVHFVSPALYGLALGGGLFGGEPLGQTAALALAAFFLWGMGSHAFGAVQDVISDREAGIGSVATVWGARTAVWIAVALYALAGGLMLFAPWPISLTAVIALPYLAAVLPFVAITDETATKAHGGWRWFLGINFFAGALVTLVGINAGYLPG
jgi:4-hydroxybenzoate polyprenyltransferase